MIMPSSLACQNLVKLLSLFDFSPEHKQGLMWNKWWVMKLVEIYSWANIAPDLKKGLMRDYCNVIC